MRRLVIGTRGSRLALVQAREVSRALSTASSGLEIVLREITTAGDRDRTRSIPSMGETGVFVREIERALLAGEVDVAVHSLKDLPVEQPAGLMVGATPVRGDPRDVLACREASGFDDLPQGARVGTSSVRRAAQLLALRDDLDVQPIRGNVDTRLDKLARGDYDAIVVARAALDRLGRTDACTEVLAPEVFLPAPGQGALAVEVREGDLDVLRHVASINDTTTFVTTHAERDVLSRLGGGCHLPLGALAEAASDGTFVLRAVLLSEDGRRAVRAEATGTMEDPGEVVDIIVRQLSEREI